MSMWQHQIVQKILQYKHKRSSQIDVCHVYVHRHVHVYALGDADVHAHVGPDNAVRLCVLCMFTFVHMQGVRGGGGGH